MRYLRFFSLLVGVLVVSACSDLSTGPQLPTDVNFDPSLGIDLAAMTHLGNGLYIETLEAGTGREFTSGDEAVVSYTLWLPDGNVVDSNSSWRHTIAPGSVIDGFLLGMEGMAIGETRRIVIPSDLGYGHLGNWAVPPNSVLVYRVTLLDLNPVD